jgi:hypothetical protein
MSNGVLSGISIAFGVAIGGMLGFHDARQAPAQPATASAEFAVPARTAVQPARAVAIVPPAENRKPPARGPRLDVSPPAPETAGQLEPQARSAPQAPKAPRVMLQNARLTPARAATPPPMARFADDPRDKELRNPRAVFRAESACARKDPEQCLRAARAFRVGIAIDPKPGTASIYWHSAQRIYEERCKRREPLSCVGLAVMYEKGPGTQPTYAPDLIEHARGICKHRNQEHCDELDAEKERLRTLLEELNTPAPSEED